MLKPIYGAASIGVVRVNDEEQLEKAYKRVTRELAKAHIVAGALQQGSDEDEDDAANEAIEATVQQVSPMLCVIQHSSFFWGPARMQHDVPPEGGPGFTLTCVGAATLLNKMLVRIAFTCMHTSQLASVTLPVALLSNFGFGEQCNCN